MPHALRQPGKLFLQDERFAGEDIYAGRHALVPVLIGLSMPVVLAIFFAPEWFDRTNLAFITAYLAIIFAVAGTIFVNVVFNPGLITEATFDQKARSVDFVRHGAFGTTRFSVAFRQIADVYLNVKFDDEGQRTLLPTVLLKNGETLLLPEGTTARDIDTIRTMIGV